MNYFPHGEETPLKKFRISDKAISLSACYYEDGEYVLRLFNDNPDTQTVSLDCGGVTTELQFGKYEVKTVLFDGKRFEEKQVWL